LQRVILRFGSAAYLDDEVESEEAEGDGTELVAERAEVDGMDESGDDATEVIPVLVCSGGVIQHSDYALLSVYQWQGVSKTV
jgi:hypothetical protein